MALNKHQQLKQEIQSLKEELQRYQEFDKLTGLYNRDAFYERIKHALDDKDTAGMIMSVDIEQFKLINDLYGTSVGDDILRFIAHHLKMCFSDPDMVCGRINSDIFALFLPDQNDPLERIQDIKAIFSAAPCDMDVNPAIGIYPITDKTLPVSLMCDRAIMAANAIKGIYMKCYCYYDDSMRSHLLEEQQLLTGLEKALDNGEFQIYMQPKCDMLTNRVVGAEALVRWNHPQKGMIPPNEFIPMFEKNGFITRLDEYVWEQSATWLEGWSKNHKPFPVSINVSRMDILQLDVAAFMEQLCRQHQLEPSLLELEITESAYMYDSQTIIEFAKHLMNNGFTVLMDDFGSGYSSLNLLKDINVNILKLDLRFLDKQDTRSRNILESILQMARWLGLHVIAEGVEDKSQVSFLLDIGCRYAQGFYYHRSMPLQEYEQLLLEEEKKKPTTHAPGHEEWKTNMLQLRDLLQDNSLSEILLNNILGAVAVFSYHDNNISLVMANEAYYTIRQDCWDEEKSILKFAHQQEWDTFCHHLETAHTKREQGSEAIFRVRSKRGVDRWLKMRFFYLSERNEQQIVYASIQDVTDYMCNLEELRQSREAFRIAMEANRITLFELDIPKRQAAYSKHTRDIFQLKDCITLNAPEGFIEQGSVCAGYEETLRQLYAQIYAGQDRASCVIKARMKGMEVLNRITLTAVKDAYGESVKAIGIVETIEETEWQNVNTVQ